MNQIKILVIIPSHIRYDGQDDLLQNAIKSVEHPNVTICLAISFETKYKKELVSIMKTYPKILYKLSPTQKFPLEHIISCIDIIDKYNLVAFCDDDDTFHSERIKEILDTTNALNDKNISGIIDGDGHMHEYWAYILKPSVIQDFHQKIVASKMTSLLHYEFSDLYFRNYLIKLKTKWCKLDKLYYNYNNKNNNSITFTYHNIWEKTKSIDVNDPDVVYILYHNFMMSFISCSIKAIKNY